MLRFAIAVVAATIPVSIRADSIDIQIQQGVICDLTIEGQVDAPETDAGQINLIDQTRLFDVETARVPAILGLSFGLRTIPNADLAGGHIVVTHPAMDPNGTTRQSWTVSFEKGRPALNLYTFEGKDELVQGRWHFELRNADGILATRAFDVTAPGTVFEVDAICSGATLSS